MYTGGRQALPKACARRPQAEKAGARALAPGLPRPVPTWGPASRSCAGRETAPGSAGQPPSMPPTSGCPTCRACIRDCRRICGSVQAGEQGSRGAGGSRASEGRLHEGMVGSPKSGTLCHALRFVSSMRTSHPRRLQQGAPNPCLQLRSHAPVRRPRRGQAQHRRRACTRRGAAGGGTGCARGGAAGCVRAGRLVLRVLRRVRLGRSRVAGLRCAACCLPRLPLRVPVARSWRLLFLEHSGSLRQEGGRRQNGLHYARGWSSTSSAGRGAAGGSAARLGLSSHDCLCHSSGPLRRRRGERGEGTAEVRCEATGGKLCAARSQSRRQLVCPPMRAETRSSAAGFAARAPSTLAHPLSLRCALAGLRIACNPRGDSCGKRAARQILSAWP